MLVPLLALYRTLRYKFPFPVIVQQIAMTAVFLANLQHHTTYSHVFFVRVTSWYNISSVYSMVTCAAMPLFLTKRIREKTSTFLRSDFWHRDSILLVILVFLGLIQYRLSLSNSLEVELQLYERVDGVCSMVTIQIMGAAAKIVSIKNAATTKYKKEECQPISSLWNYFCWSVATFAVLQIVVTLEERLCDLKGDGGWRPLWVLKRTYHGTVIHACIAIVFSRASYLTLQIVRSAMTEFGPPSRRNSSYN